MIQVRWIGSFTAVALGGAILAFASPGCEESADEPPRDEAANDEPTDERPPAPDDEEGDDEHRKELEWSRRAPPEPSSDRPRCHGDGWHDSGICLTRCSGDAAYAIASERRTIDYKWCFARASQYCGERGVKLHDACWGIAGDRRDGDESDE
jgi:hypothetical protein